MFRAHWRIERRMMLLCIPAAVLWIGLRPRVAEPRRRVGDILNVRFSSPEWQMAAEVTAIDPNGALVLDAHRHFRINDDVWERTLHGKVRRADVLADGSVSTRDMYELTVMSSGPTVAGGAAPVKVK